MDYLQSSWVTDEEFGMGYLELKAPPVHTPKHTPSQNGLVGGESTGGRSTANQQPESGGKDQLSKTKIPDGRTENMPPSKSDQGHPKSKGGNPSDAQPSVSKKPVDQKETDESPKISDENPVKAGSKYSEAEVSSCSLLFYLFKLATPALLITPKVVTGTTQNLYKIFILPLLLI